MRASKNSNVDLEDAVRTFQDYVGIKLHFNDHLVWKRDTKLRLGQEQLMKRKDAFVFLRMNEQEPEREDRIQRLISMFKRDRSSWSGAIFEEENTHFHKQRMTVVRSLKHVVRTDIDRLVMFMEERKIDVRKLLLSDGQSPYIISHEYDIIGGITDETLALLNRAFKFCNQETIDPLWKERSFMLNKYGYCLDVESEFLKHQFNKLVAAQ